MEIYCNLYEHNETNLYYFFFGEKSGKLMNINELDFRGFFIRMTYCQNLEDFLIFLNKIYMII